MLSDRLKTAMQFSGLSQADLARACRVKPPSIHGWLSGKSKFLRGENLLSAAAALGVSQRWLATGEGAMVAEQPTLSEPSTGVSLKYAYRHGIIQGGDNGFIDCVPPSAQDPEPVAYASTMRDEQAYAVKVRGNSMEPAIMQGWDVIASPNRPAQPPDLCVVYFADDRKALKRFLWQRDGLVCLESLHVDHRKMTEQASGILRMDKVIAIVPN